DGIDGPAASVVRHPVHIDAIPEAIEGLPESDDACIAISKELLREGSNATNACRFVVFDDVAVLSFFGEKVVDQGLRFESEEVVDRRLNEEHLLRPTAHGRAYECFERRACEPELQLAFDTART